MENANSQHTNQSILSSIWDRYANFLVTLVILFLAGFGLEFKLQFGKLISDDVRSIVFTLTGLTLFFSGAIFSVIVFDLVKEGWIVKSYTIIKETIRFSLFFMSLIAGVSVAEKFAKESDVGIKFGFYAGLFGVSIISITLLYKFLKNNKFFKNVLPHTNESQKRFSSLYEYYYIDIKSAGKYIEELDNLELNKKLHDDDFLYFGGLKYLTFMSDEEWSVLIPKLDQLSVQKIVNSRFLNGFFVSNPAIALELLARKKQFDAIILEEELLINKMLQDKCFDLNVIKNIKSSSVKKKIGEIILNEFS